MFKFFLIFILFFVINNCSNQVNYSGKILSQDNLEDLNFKNKSNLVDKFGSPSFIDPVTKKYFYFSEKNEKKSIFKKNIDYSYIFVFEFDNEDIIVSSNVYDLKNKDSVELVKEETNSDIVKRGLLEKIFGGVGPRKEITTTP